MNKFYVIINDAKPDYWSEWLWKDISKIDGVVKLDSCTLPTNSLLKRFRSVHFSNKINKYIKLPFKSIWNKCVSIKPIELDKSNRNYLIFQGNVKFPPGYIKHLKTMYNACIVLYLYDTIEKLGIGKNKGDFNKYCKYYSIDMAFTFDYADSNMLHIPYFDLYSSLTIQNNDDLKKETSGIFYIGNCRSKDRLNALHSIFEKCKGKIECDFYLVGVEKEDMKYPDAIHYNHSLTYTEIMKKIKQYSCILEITNPGQTGYTVRFKEAICFNKRLLTNNPNVKKSKYYDDRMILLFDDPKSIPIDWVVQNEKKYYNYSGEFSPLALSNIIINADKGVK